MGRAADPATLLMDEPKPAVLQTTALITPPPTNKPKSTIPTMPPPLLPNNLKCTANTIDNRYGRNGLKIFNTKIFIDENA